MSGHDEVALREAAAARVLLDHDLTAAGVRAGGPDGEIALLSAPRAHWGRLLGPDATALLAAIRAVGFRYVALDLDAEGE